MSDDPVETCPECGEDEAERLMSAGAGLVFKGSGFYETDYRRSGRQESGEGQGGDGGDSADGAEASAGDGGSSDPDPGGDGGTGES